MPHDILTVNYMFNTPTPGAEKGKQRRSGTASLLALFIITMLVSCFASAATYKVPKIISSRYTSDRNIEITAAASSISWSPKAADKQSLYMTICKATDNMCTTNIAYSSCSPYGNQDFTRCVNNFNSQVGGTKTWWVPGGVMITNDICIRIIAWNAGQSASTQTYLQNDCTPGIGIPEPPPAWCAMNLGSVLINFGTLTKNAAAGSSKAETLSVYCENDAKYKLSLTTGTSAIALNNGMSAMITVDGAALGTTLTGYKGTATKVITATLAGTPITTGAFSGTGILRVDML